MNRQIVQEAAEWFVEFSTDDVDPSARRKFDEWLRASPAHLQAYLSMVPLWEEGARVEIPNGMTADALVGWVRQEDNIVSLQASELLSQPANALSNHSLRRYIVAAAAAACLALAAVGVWFANRSPIYSTEFGEQRSIELRDGSIVELNSHSRIQVHFSDRVRSVDLLEGQALFRVSRDPSRPFVVQSEKTRVRAVGTEFDMYRRSSGTTVTVLEGRVAVWQGARDDSDAAPDSKNPTSSSIDAARSVASNGGELLLAVGEQVTIGARNDPQPRHADVAAVTAWRQRQLVFDKASLRYVAEEFNRYNSKRLIVEDDELQELTVSGVFSSTNPSSLVRFLKAQPDLDVVESADDSIHIIGKKSINR